MKLHANTIGIWIEKHNAAVLVGIVGLNLLFGLLLFDPKLNTGGDNSYYISLAESIIRSGDGYSLTFDPAGPKPFVLYPFGYPLLLSPLYALLGRNLIAFKLLSLCFAAGSVLLFSLLIRPVFKKSLLWASLSLAVAVNPEIINYSHWVLSDIPYLFFSLLSFFLFLRSEKKEPDKAGPLFWFALLSIAFTIYIRSIGYAFTVSGLMYFISRRKLKKLILFLAGLCLLLAPWVIRNNMVQSDSPALQAIYQKEFYNPEKGDIEAEDLLPRIKINILNYSIYKTIQIFVGSRIGDDGVGENNLELLSILLTLLITAGFIKTLIIKKGYVEFYTLVYLAVIMIMPQNVAVVRYLLPLIPMLFIYLVEGVTLLATVLPFSFKVRQTNSPALVMSILITLTGFSSLCASVPGNLDMIRRYMNGDRYAGCLDNWRHFFLAAEWAGRNTPQSSTFTTRNPGLFYLVSGRKASEFPLTTQRDSLYRTLTDGDYVVINMIRFPDERLSVHRTIQEFLLPVMEQYIESFKLRYKTESPYTYLWQVVEPQDKTADSLQAEKAAELYQKRFAFMSLLTSSMADIEKSINYYKRKIEKEGVTFESVEKIARFSSETGEIEEAASYYEIAVELQPNNQDALFNAGKANFLLKRYEKAKDFYRRVLTVNPLHIHALVDSGLLEKCQGKLGNAEQLFLRALEIDSLDIYANKNYADFLVQVKKSKLGQNNYKKVLEKKPYDINAHRSLAKVYTDNKQYKEALNHYRILAILLPEERAEIEMRFIVPLTAEVNKTIKN